MITALSPVQRPPRWFWVLPRVAVFAALLTVGFLIWLLHRNDIEAHRAALIGDVLWVEQDLRFHLERNVEQLRLLGLDRVTGQVDSRVYELRVRSILAGGQGLVRLMFVDAGGERRSDLSRRNGAATEGETSISVPSADTFRLARQLGTPQYSGARPVAASDTRFEIHVPLFHQDDFAGMMVGVYSMRTLLAQFVPWWFAEKYKVSVIDDSGNVLATKSNVSTGEATQSYQVAFDPPGHGLALQVVAYRRETRLLPALLLATIAALSIAIVYSLWALRRHVQGRYEAELALREEHAFRKAMEDSLLTGLRARDLEGRITYVNPAFCRMVGWSQVELIGLKPPMPYWPPEDAERIRAIHDTILAGSGPSEGVEVRLMRRNGERFDALIYEAPLIDASGHHTGWMGSMLDITERKRTQELARAQQDKLQFTSRLVTMGELASSLAHELNQPLAAIASYNAGCLNRMEAGDFNCEDMIQASRKLGHQAQRAGQIIRRIYEFVRRSEPKREPCNLNAVIDDAVGLIEADARKCGVRMALQAAQPLPPVMADRVMMEQVILNLVRNGIEAMGEVSAGRKILTISTRADDAVVTVSVADQGCGISDETAARLYAPFFTTKPEGMGMGLNICRSIIELHAGRLWFESRPGAGTVFSFSLPAIAS
jgi:two-component system sensor histidine kinase DctS